LNIEQGLIPHQVRDRLIFDLGIENKNIHVSLLTFGVSRLRESQCRKAVAQD
jgi:hypothetical protein